MSQAQRFSLDANEPLLVEKNWHKINRALSTHVNSHLRELECAEILEAGCGKRWLLDLPDTRYRLVGIDLDEEALRIREDRVGDLDQSIVADLQSVTIPVESYDMVYSSYVLEHISDASALTSKMLSWVRPGGLLLIKIPIRESVFGFITRITPLWCHVLYHRYVLGIKNAGTPGSSPYPTYYDPIVSVEGFRSFIETNDLQVLYARGTNFGFSKNTVVRGLVASVTTLISLFSFGRLTSRFNGLAIVMAKPLRNS